MADFNQAWNDLNNTPDATGEFDPNDVEKNRGISVLAYLSWLVVIPLFAAKDSPYARFHCNQGLVLAITEVVCGLVLRFLGKLPLIGWVFSILGAVVGVSCFLFAVLGAINALRGRAKELPFIGGIRLL